MLSFSQVVAVMSYGLFGHALTLIICTIGSDRWFMPMLTVVGGLGKYVIIIIVFQKSLNYVVANNVFL